jgi:hypothetical protein
MRLEGQAAQLMDGVAAANPNTGAGTCGAETNIELNVQLRGLVAL